MNPIYTSATAPSGSAPTITSFTATPTSISAGGSVSLAWSVSNASYVIVSPDQVRSAEPAQMFSPPPPLLTTLYATDQYGRTQATVTVTVP